MVCLGGIFVFGIVVLSPDERADVREELEIDWVRGGGVWNAMRIIVHVSGKGCCGQASYEAKRSGCCLQQHIKKAI